MEAGEESEGRNGHVPARPAVVAFLHAGNMDQPEPAGIGKAACRAT
jgi:hypothetical protein